MCVAWFIILRCLSESGFFWNVRVGSKHLRRGWFVSSSPQIDVCAESRRRPKETIQHSCSVWQDFLFLLISACLELSAASSPHHKNGSVNIQDVRGYWRSCWLLLYEQNQPSVQVRVYATRSDKKKNEDMFSLSLRWTREPSTLLEEWSLSRASVRHNEVQSCPGKVTSFSSESDLSTETISEQIIISLKRLKTQTN